MQCILRNVGLEMWDNGGKRQNHTPFREADVGGHFDAVGI